MKAPWIAGLLLVVVAGVSHAQESLQAARQRLLRVNYAEALEQYEKLAKEPKTVVPATVGISRAHESTGEYDKALAVVEALLKQNPKDDSLLARQAELLYLRGRWADAEKAADAAVAARNENFPARWVRAQIYRDRGELKKADDECRWFVRTYSARSDMEKDITDPEELVLVGLAGCENARWNKLADQFDFILKEVYRDALKFDKYYWPAEYQAAVLLLEKYNRAEGMPALENVLKINPNCAEAKVAKGTAALQKFNFKTAEAELEDALKTNPHLPEALRLKADIAIMSGDIAAALKALDAARKINPVDEYTLGRVGACFIFQKKQAEFDTLAKEVEKNNPSPGVFYMIAADRLDERRYYADAEKFYRKAIAFRPKLSAASAQLSLLLMRMGEEKEARKLLDNSYELDPFNVRVANTRRVLKHLDGYETIKTAHFEIRFDPKSDAVLAHYLADQVEGLYDELAEQFQHKPKGPILFEIFNNHDMFSGRVVALPDLHTIGACTGRMFAMVSPNGKGVNKKFNWMRVVRHELVHIFNLDQTSFLVPHWLTEGLAVTNEKIVRPATWNAILKRRHAAGKLLTLETVNLGFIRPGSGEEWLLAYCQSLLYVEYIKAKYGPATIGVLLNCYRDGMDTPGAIEKACKVKQAEFEKGYREYVDKIVKEIGGTQAEEPMELADLKAASEKDPNNLNLKARLAEETLSLNRVEARKLAKAVLEKEPKHPRASVVMARLAILGGDVDEARKILEGALDKEKPDTKLLLALGKMYYDASEFDKAADAFL